MNDRELMQMALDALDRATAYDPLIAKTMTGLRARLAQPEPEPIAWQWLNTAHFRKHLPKDAEKGAWRALYAAATPREWQGLTDEEANELTYASIAEIEAKLKEKNNGTTT